MLNQRSKHWDKLCDLLDEHFPKGKCKERGRAIVLVSYIDMMLQEEEQHQPVGVSQWKEMGKKYGYDQYFKIIWPII